MFGVTARGIIALMAYNHPIWYVTMQIFPDIPVGFDNLTLYPEMTITLLVFGTKPVPALSRLSYADLRPKPKFDTHMYPPDKNMGHPSAEHMLLVEGTYADGKRMPHEAVRESGVCTFNRSYCNIFRRTSQLGRGTQI